MRKEEDPSHDRRVRHEDVALGHHGGQISIAQHVGDVLADTELYGLSLESAPAIDRIALDWPSHSCSFEWHEPPLLPPMHQNLEVPPRE